ncbi:hypothetical protein [Zooshikella sp. RANM57]|uniref:hypothetical protein n=1 Tax=Zooshikella sp. RANM57 TaxID=3425863 RepID=UPI003D6FB3F4
MKQTDSFKLIGFPKDAYDDVRKGSALYINDHNTNTVIPGYCIEAQYKTSVGYLLVTSFDCPFEESNVFILLDLNYRVLAKKYLQMWYETFLLKAHWSVSDTKLMLHYQGNLNYSLTIKPKILGRGYKLVLQKEAATLVYDASSTPSAH